MSTLNVTQEQRRLQLLAWADSRPMNRRHWAIFLVCAVAFLFDSFDLQVISLVAPILAKQWHLSSQVLGLVIASVSVGMLVGSIFSACFPMSLVEDRDYRSPSLCLPFSAVCARAHKPRHN